MNTPQPDILPEDGNIDTDGKTTKDYGAKQTPGGGQGDEERNRRPVLGALLFFLLILCLAAAMVLFAPEIQSALLVQDGDTATPADSGDGGSADDGSADGGSTDGDSVTPLVDITPGGTCGDGTCSEGENSDLCGQDCQCNDNGVADPGEGCGCLDVVCDGEEITGVCGGPCPAGQCAGGLSCLNGVCWDSTICGGGEPSDGGDDDGGGGSGPGPVCGDGKCNGNESSRSCPSDCGKP